jgi:Dehydrogenase E1 component
VSAVDPLVQLAEADAALQALDPLPYSLPLGRLAPLVAGAFLGMKRSDWAVVGPRERIGAVMRGCGVDRLVDPAKGARPYKLAPSTAAPGNRALHAVGLALASGEPVLCILGLASAASGATHEALNAAALTGAPVIFVVGVHPIGDDAPVGRQLAASPAALAAAFGLASVVVANTSAAVSAAVADARATGKPALIEVNLES